MIRRRNPYPWFDYSVNTKLRGLVEGMMQAASLEDAKREIRKEYGDEIPGKIIVRQRRESNPIFVEQRAAVKRQIANMQRLLESLKKRL